VADHLASRNRSSTSDSSPPAVQNKRIICPKNLKQVKILLERLGRALVAALRVDVAQLRCKVGRRSSHPVK
jgi:hypothetical protein